MKIKKIIFIVGPTGVGKTKVGYLLARKINGEIISCDAMQVYKEVSIASNKPPAAMCAKIPHHLIDVVSVTRDFDVATFEKKALAAIRALHRKNKIPIVVGGSGLYMSVLLDGIFKGPASNPALRKKLEDLAKKKGSSFLHKRLVKIDPVAAVKIHPNDTRRIIRALEVFETFRTPISQLQKKRSGLWGKYDIAVFALTMERKKLYEIIEQRVDEMFAHGLIDELARLERKPWSHTARGIIGVKEIAGYLNAEYSEEHARYLMKRNTRRYAKRQLTWFRRDTRLRWITLDEKNTPAQAAQHILKEIKK